MNEIISGIQVIKMYTWERPFAKLVEYARRSVFSILKAVRNFVTIIFFKFSRAEIKQITYTSYIKGVFLSFIMFTTRVTVYVTVVAYVLLGNRISAEKVKSHNPPLLSHQKIHI
jgi:ATP-binding cassette, subfamily C (CFTR/MRP), member 4